MSMKEQIELIVSNMKRWQKIEDASVASTGKVIEQSDNPVVRLVMEIIQRDSQMHRRVQELIAASLESQVTTLTPDELAKVWSLIEKHIEIEEQTIELAQSSLEAIGDSKMMVIQKYLLEYMLEDESKHNRMLENLAAIKSGMYPYA